MSYLESSPASIDRRRSAFRRLIESQEILLVAGAGDALTARIIEDCGHQAVYVSGAAIANGVLGAPDVGLVTMSETLAVVSRVMGATSIPVLVDADTGFGGPLNVYRAVREFGGLGVAGVQLEDQADPKRCGHFDGKRVLEPDEMEAKLRAAVAAREDRAMVIVARTDALAIHGFDNAVERARRYAAAGADLIFVEAPETVEQLRALPRLIDAPLLANMVEGGRTPVATTKELEGMGYAVALFANTALRAGMKAIQTVMSRLLADGTSAAVSDSLVTWDERQRLVGFPEMQALDASF